jgi:hypothetical protein
MFQNFGFNRQAVKVTGAANDPAAQAFIDATGVTGTTAAAINQLVLDLKSFSLWTKMVAIYPLVGGTSASTSYNLVNTATYQITWNGGVTFASTGITGNGTTGWGDTNLNPTTNGTMSSGAHLSNYTRTAGNTNAYDMGCNLFPASSPSVEWMIARFGNDRYAGFGNTSPGNPFVAGSTTNYTGFFTGTGNSSLATTTIYRNGSSLAAQSKTYGVANNDIALCGGLNSAGAVNDKSTREYAFFSVGQYYDATEVTNLNTCVTTFQTTLGRNV